MLDEFLKYTTNLARKYGIFGGEEISENGDRKR